eukprot:Awhi_evm1s5949
MLPTTQYITYPPIPTTEFSGDGYEFGTNCDGSGFNTFIEAYEHCRGIILCNGITFEGDIQKYFSRCDGWSFASAVSSDTKSWKLL